MQRRIIALTATAVIVGGGAIAIAVASGSDGSDHRDRRASVAGRSHHDGQGDTDATTPSPGSRPSIMGGGEGDGPAGRGPGGFGRGGDVVATAATAIGVSADALKAELQAGKSMADVAAVHQVATSKVVDALVADLTAHFTDPGEIAEHGQDEVDRIVAQARTSAEKLVQTKGMPTGGIGGGFGGGFGPGDGDGPGDGGHHDDDASAGA